MPRTTRYAMVRVTVHPAGAHPKYTHEWVGIYDGNGRSAAERKADARFQAYASRVALAPNQYLRATPAAHVSSRHIEEAIAAQTQRYVEDELEAAQALIDLHADIEQRAEARLRENEGN
jgi:hypothetical protein